MFFKTHWREEMTMAWCSLFCSSLSLVLLFLLTSTPKFFSPLLLLLFHRLRLFANVISVILEEIVTVLFAILETRI